MKRIIMLAMALMMLLVSIGGCWVVWEDGRGGRGREHEERDRDRDHDRDRGHDWDQRHEERR